MLALLRSGLSERASTVPLHISVSREAHASWATIITERDGCQFPSASRDTYTARMALVALVAREAWVSLGIPGYPWVSREAWEALTSFHLFSSICA